MNKANTTKALQDAEAQIKKHGGKGAMDKPAAPRRSPPVTHGPVGVGPTPKRKST